MVNACGDYSGEIQSWFLFLISLTDIYVYFWLWSCFRKVSLINSKDIQIWSSYVNSSYQKTSRLWFEAGWEEGQLKDERAQSLKWNLTQFLLHVCKYTTTGSSRFQMHRISQGRNKLSVCHLSLSCTYWKNFSLRKLKARHSKYIPCFTISIMWSDFCLLLSAESVKVGWYWKGF